MPIEDIVKPPTADLEYRWIADWPPILRHSLPGPEFHTHLPPERLYRLCSVAYCIDANGLAHVYQRECARRPQDVLVMMPNEAAAHRELLRRGVPSVFVNHNAFVDERVYRVMPEVAKRYDAVYTARMNPFKRHVLARNIARLLLIGGIDCSHDDPAYFAEVCRTLPHADFTHDERNIRLNAEQVAARLNEAHVGLCLSVYEGAMFASVEYLLCGLPVVSTDNLGGRNEFLDLRYARLVEPTTEAVAAAVAELKAARLPPAWIREQTLARMCAHRRRFIELVQSIYDREQVQRNYRTEFEAGYVGKMNHWLVDRDVMKYIDDHTSRWRRQPNAVAPLVDAPPPGLPRTWPDPVTLSVVGSRWANAWRTVQYALYLRRAVGVNVRLATPSAWVDRAGAMRDVLGAADVLACVAEDDPARLPCLTELWPWHLPRLPTHPAIETLCAAAPPDGAWFFPDTPTVCRWRGWPRDPFRRIAWLPEEGAADLDQAVPTALPGHEFICLDEARPLAECVELLSECDLAVGPPGGMIGLAYAVGVPVFLLQEGKPTGDLWPLHGDRHAVWCHDLRDFVAKARCFLGAA